MSTRLIEYQRCLNISWRQAVGVRALIYIHLLSLLDTYKVMHVLWACPHDAKFYIYVIVMNLHYLKETLKISLFMTVIIWPFFRLSIPLLAINIDRRFRSAYCLHLQGDCVGMYLTWQGTPIYLLCTWTHYNLFTHFYHEATPQSTRIYLLSHTQNARDGKSFAILLFYLMMLGSGPVRRHSRLYHRNVFSTTLLADSAVALVSLTSVADGYPFQQRRPLGRLRLLVWRFKPLTQHFLRFHALSAVFPWS